LSSNIIFIHPMIFFLTLILFFYMVTDMSVRDSNSSNTKDHIINAAVRIFFQNGFQKTRISDIVSEAGVAQGTFYLYFRSKEEIFRHINTNHMNRFVKVFEETDHLFGGKDARDIKKNVQTFLSKLLEIYKENVHVSELLFREGVGHGGLFKEVQELFFKSFIGLLKEQMKRDIPKGRFPFEDSEIIAVFLLGMFLHSSSYFMLMKKQFNTEKLSRLMSDFMLNGLQLN